MTKGYSCLDYCSTRQLPSRENLQPHRQLSEQLFSLYIYNLRKCSVGGQGANKQYPAPIRDSATNRRSGQSNWYVHRKGLCVYCGVAEAFGSRSSCPFGYGYGYQY
jgi:hypothetical protein